MTTKRNITRGSRIDGTHWDKPLPVVPEHLRPGNVMSTRTLKGQGFSDADIRHVVNSGSLTRVRQGWYAGPDPDPMVVRAVRAGGVLGCSSALVHHGAWRPLQPRLHIYRSRSERARARRRDWCTAPGCDQSVPVAVVPIDLAISQARRCLPAEEVLAQVESLVRQGVVRRSDAEYLLGPVLGSMLDVSGSGTETLVRMRLQALGIKLRTQVRIKGVGRVDFVIGDRLVLEVDSVQYHGPNAAYHSDRRRDQALLELGYLFMRITWEQVMLEWDETLRKILRLVRADRHRQRSRRAIGTT